MNWLIVDGFTLIDAVKDALKTVLNLDHQCKSITEPANKLSL